MAASTCWLTRMVLCCWEAPPHCYIWSCWWYMMHGCVLVVQKLQASTPHDTIAQQKLQPSCVMWHYMLWGYCVPILVCWLHKTCNMQPFQYIPRNNNRSCWPHVPHSLHFHDLVQHSMQCHHLHVLQNCCKQAWRCHVKLHMWHWGRVSLTLQLEYTSEPQQEHASNHRDDPLHPVWVLTHDWWALRCV